MKTKFIIIAFAFLVILPTAAKSKEQDPAAEFVRKARQYDGMYVSSKRADQQLALDFYIKAIKANPVTSQRLQILHRIARLCGSSYQIEKGEKPDYDMAILTYKAITKIYPPDEPLVLDAMISIGDHYITLWQFDQSLEWFKKALEYDVSQLEEQLADINQDSQQRRKAIKLEKTINRIRQFQKIAVTQAASAARFIHPLVADSTLRAIAETYYGSFIAETANKCLQENTERFEDVLAPVLDAEDFAIWSHTDEQYAAAPVSDSNSDQSLQQPTQTNDTFSFGPFLDGTSEQPLQTNAADISASIISNPDIPMSDSDNSYSDNSYNFSNEVPK